MKKNKQKFNISIISKVIAGLLVFSFLGGNILFSSSNVARAGYPTIDIPTIGQTIQQLIIWSANVAKEAAIESLKIILVNEIQDKVIRFANGLQENAFVVDWTNFLTKNRVEVGLDWLNDFFGVNLCADIRPQLKLLIKQGILEKEFGVTGAECTLNEVIDNTEELANYISQGDWFLWDKELEPNNNELGIYIEATTGLEGVMNKGEEKAILSVDTSKGIEAVYKCVETDEEGTCVRKEIVTHGSIVQRLKEYAMVDLPMALIENAQTFAEVAIRGVVMTSINRIYDGVRASTIESGPTTFEDYWEENAPPITITGMTAEERQYCGTNQDSINEGDSLWETCYPYWDYCNDSYTDYLKAQEEGKTYNYPEICNDYISL